MRYIFLFCTTILLIVLLGHVVYSADITIDPQQGQNASLEQAPNGVSILNITTPNSTGLSHNSLLSYNVPTQGVIINNSRQYGTSALGGLILANPNLTSHAASTIISEITGPLPSTLQGVTELFGSPAEYIVANQNGITCQGCGFIGIPQLTLTTGIPNIDGAGRLESITVNKGQLAITGSDVDWSSTNSVRLLSHAATITSNIVAGEELTVVNGRNQIKGAEIIPLSANENTPTFAIDIAQLGGMYANKINLVVTEKGAGVNNLGTIHARQGGLTITAAGDLINTKATLAAAEDVTIKAANIINDKGLIIAQKEHSMIAEQELHNKQGNIISVSGNGNIKAETLTNNSGTIESMAGSVTIDAEDVVNSRTSMKQEQYLGRTDISFGKGYYHIHKYRITGEASEPALILAAQDITINSNTILNNASSIHAAGDITITGNEINNQSHTLENWDHTLYGWRQGGSWWSMWLTPEIHSQELFSSEIHAGKALKGDIAGSINNQSIAAYVIDALDQESQAARINTLALTLPDDNDPLFTTNKERYLIATNTTMIDQSQFFNSEYVLGKLGFSPEEVGVKILGDPYFETKALTKEIFARTGRRYLSSDINSEAEQIKRLMDNAIEASNQHAWHIGKALSSKQQQALAQSVIWPVMTVVEGQTVLTPQLYLAQGNRPGVNETATLSANDIQLTSVDFKTVAL